MQHLNLFDESELYEDDALIWGWGRTTLYRFMKDNGFVYGNRITHYENTRLRANIVTMRDNYLECINHYRDKGY